MWNFAGPKLWRAAYLRAVRSAFATVPLYRERWALDGRTDPVLVPGRTGTSGGAIDPSTITHRAVDLVPLGGGSPGLDPLRGLGTVLAQDGDLPGGALLAVLDSTGVRPPTDLPRGVRGCVLDAAALGDGASAALADVRDRVQRREPVVAVGSDKDLGLLVEAVGAGVRRVPARELDQLDGGPSGVLLDHQLGALGGLRDCGRWHLDWARVHARQTPAGLAFSLLRQRSPRLIDVLVAGGVPGEVAPCPRHGTPVVLT